MRVFIVILDGLILACSFYTLTSVVAYTHKWLWESKRELKHMRLNLFTELGVILQSTWSYHPSEYPVKSVYGKIQK